MNARLSLIALLAAGGLASCAKMGELDQPPPLFGAKAKADYEAKKHQAEAERARAAAAKATPSQERTPDTDLPLNAAPRPAPPVPGVNDPFGAPPPTSLPQPGTPGAQ